jgi:predicted AlkP superfamily phosphohydrolase/phosphomutase
MSRVLVIGWDGADWRILDPMLEAGVLPNLRSLIDRGAKGVLRSTLPTHSWTAWPSFLTGVEPGRHGVFDILETKPGTTKQYPVTYRSIRERTFLGDLKAAGKAVVFTDVPLTFPAPNVEGVLIAGGVLPKGHAFTHPASLAEDLERAGTPWPINGMSWTTFHNRPMPLLEEAARITAARQRVNEKLLDETDWSVACLVYVATDRIQHCLASHISPDHPDYASLSKTDVAARIRDVYRQLDEGLGALVSRAREDDTVLFMSDHGFHACTRAMHMDKLLQQLGYLEFTASQALLGRIQAGKLRALARRVYDLFGLHGKVSLPQPVNWAKTRAYTSIRSTGEGVSVNLAGREPNGIVDPAEFEALREEVGARLGAFRDPLDGRSPIASIRRREEMFSGDHLDHAPDLLLEPAAGFSLTHAKSVIEDAGWAVGDHRVEGVIAGTGPRIRPDAFAEDPALIDLAPTILAAVGAPASVKHDGQVLTGIVGTEAAVRAGTAATDDVSTDDAGPDDTEAAEMEEHLRGLGYLE